MNVTWKNASKNKQKSNEQKKTENRGINQKEEETSDRATSDDAKCDSVGELNSLDFLAYNNNRCALHVTRKTLSYVVAFIRDDHRSMIGRDRSTSLKLKGL